MNVGLMLCVLDMGILVFDYTVLVRLFKLFVFVVVCAVSGLIWLDLVFSCCWRLVI